MRANTFPLLLLTAPRPHHCTRCDTAAPPRGGFYYAGDQDHELCLDCLEALGVVAPWPVNWPPLAGRTPRPPTEDEIEEPRLGLCAATVADLRAAFSVAQGRLDGVLALLRGGEDERAADLAETLRADANYALHEFHRHQEEVCAVCGLEEFYLIGPAGDDDHDVFVDGGLTPLHAECVGQRTPDGRLCGQCDSCGGFGIGLEVLPGTQYAQCPECAGVAVPHPRELTAVAAREEAA